MYSYKEILNTDPEIAEYIAKEYSRQSDHIELIASENWVSNAVMAATGSILTNKYAEGYPGRRYYGGCEWADRIEDLAIKRAKKLFNCEYVNVQPHSGAQANMAVEYAVLEPGDTVLGLSLNHGGHLTHGSPVNLSGKYYNFISYGVDDNGYIDYEQIETLAREHNPKMIISGASAYARTIDFDRIGKIAKETGAVHFADIAHIAGLVASGLHPSPFPGADIVTTTTHKTLRGPRGGMIMSTEEANERFNFNKAIFPGTQGGPLLHAIAAKAVCLKEALEPEFKEYCAQVIKNAKALSDELQVRGVSIVSNGTDNHLMLVNLIPDNVTGKEIEKLLDMANITANKNTVPNDPQSPFVTSGIRLGTPSATSRGLVEEDFKGVAKAISLIIHKRENAIIEARGIIKEITDRYPLSGAFEE